MPFIAISCSKAKKVGHKLSKFAFANEVKVAVTDGHTRDIFNLKHPVKGVFCVCVLKKQTRQEKGKYFHANPSWNLICSDESFY